MFSNSQTALKALYSLIFVPKLALNYLNTAQSENFGPKEHSYTDVDTSMYARNVRVIKYCR